MASPVLGIDLGTTNSVVAYADQARVRVLRDEDGHLLMPSVVSFHPTGQILVGHSARERRLVDAENTVFSIKRLIGRPFRSPEVQRGAERVPFKLEEGGTGGVVVCTRGETYSLPEISSFVLRKLRAIAEQALGQSCVNAVITVPANFNELQRMATRDAGRIAGLNVLRILNEPTAAALAYGFQERGNQRVAVYDFGGGTFDISILELSGDVIEVIATAGDTYLGGDDIDRLIADRMIAEFLQAHHVDLAQDTQAYERVRMAAEWIKCQLSMLESAQAAVTEVAYGPGGSPIDLSFRLARAELDRMIFPLVGRTFDICEDALRLANVRPSQLDAVILVGGQTRTLKVRDMVGEYFGMAPQSSVDPDLVVAQGAALQGYALSASAKTSAAPSFSRTLSGSPVPEDPSFDDVPTVVVKRAPSTLPIAVFSPPPPPPSTDVSEGSEAGAVAPDGVLKAARVPNEALAVSLSGEGEVSEDELPPVLRESLFPEEPEPTPPKLVPSASAPTFDEPIRTHSMARLLAKQGHKERALSIYDELLAKHPADEALVQEAQALRDGEPSSASSAPPSASSAPSASPSSSAPSSASDESTSISRSQFPVLSPARKPPLLLDVTPHTLSVETAGGYCEQVIERNAPIPTEQTRVFSTSQDKQKAVIVRVCQGEARRTDDNQVLGRIELVGLREAPRGDVSIAVTFIIDADGTLHVNAQDRTTGKAQAIRVSLVGALGEQDIGRMRERQARAG